MSTTVTLYPLKFHPTLKHKVWGGTKLGQVLNKNAQAGVGESWEVSGVEGNISEIKNGRFRGKNLNWLLETYKEKLVGQKVYQDFGTKFPLLFKFIDAREDLSVQVHPDDHLARQRHNSFGKTEMWYILDTDTDARLIIGFNQKVDVQKYLRYLSDHKITELLHSETIRKGDAFILKPGTVHAIGAGVLLAEIQQTSDITYRIYDWDRPDTDGQMRELHTDLALEAIDFNPSTAKLNYSETENMPSPIGTTEFFTVNKLVLAKTYIRNLADIPSFVVYMCTEGTATLETDGYSETISKGETILLPAEIPELKFITQSATFLEVYIP